jgi:AhpD family alkylhydroperoxidase
LVEYGPEFYGDPMKAVTQDAMRGPSAWSVGDRELMAAIVAKTNECVFCTKAHAAVATGAYQDDAAVSAVLTDLESADIGEPLRVTTARLLLRQPLALDAQTVSNNWASYPRVTRYAKLARHTKSSQAEMSNSPKNLFACAAKPCELGSNT